MKFRVFWEVLPCSQVVVDNHLTSRQRIPEDSELQREPEISHGFCMILSVTRIICLNSINKLIFVMVKRGVLLEVRTKFINII
jgi:hypothetical protein